MNGALSGEELERASHLLLGVKASVAAVYIGDQRPVDLMLVGLLARGHVLLEGVPGVAKTTLVRAFSVALGCSVRRVQFTPDLLPSDVTGTYVLSPKDGSFSFRPGPIFANVVLADEINRAPAKTQSALLEAMQERQVTVEGESFGLPEPFVVLATQNPIDLEGTYPLPEAQLDRFLVQIRLGYPSPQDELRMLQAHGVAAPTLRPALSIAELTSVQQLTDRVHVEEDLMEYAVALARFTRQRPGVLLGASPRATLGLLRAARARAVVEGRNYVIPDDLRVIAPAVLSHRIVMDVDAESDASVRGAVVDDALRQVSYRRAIRAT